VVQRSSNLSASSLSSADQGTLYTVHLSKFESVTCPEPGILGCYEERLPNPERADPYKIAVEIEL
jgi:hypothetical protein